VLVRAALPRAYAPAIGALSLTVAALLGLLILLGLLGLLRLPAVLLLSVLPFVVQRGDVSCWCCPMVFLCGERD